MPSDVERLGRHPVALVDQAEQEMLGADVVVVEQARFLLRQHDHTAGPVGEPFEHDPERTTVSVPEPGGGCAV